MGEQRRVNRTKVLWSIRRYRGVTCFVLCYNALLVYWVGSLFLATRASAVFFMLSIAAFLFGVACGMPKPSLRPSPPGVCPIDVSRYGWLVELWRARCLNYGAIPGPVFMTKQIGEGMLYESFAVANVDLIRMHPVLYISDRMASLLRPEIVGPIIEHELGHCRITTRLLFVFLEDASARGTLVLAFFSAWRRLLAVSAPRLAQGLLFLERISFWGSSCAIRQYGEYAADALMAEAVDDEGPLVNMLRRVHEDLAEVSGVHCSPDDTHLANHPPMECRIKAIEELFD